MLTASYEAVLYWHDREETESVLNLAGVVFVLLLALWIEEDSKTQPQIYRPFEHGQLAFLLWTPYVPYYLWRTRGSRGLLMLCGFIFLLLSGWFVQWLIYLAR